MYTSWEAVLVLLGRINGLVYTGKEVYRKSCDVNVVVERKLPTS